MCVTGIVPLFYIGSRALYNILTTTLIAKNFDAKNFVFFNFGGIWGNFGENS